MDNSGYLIPVLCFTAVAVATYVALAWLDPYWVRVRGRVEEIRESGAPIRSAGSGAPRLGALLQWVLPHGADSRSRLRQRLAKAGIYRRDAVARYYLATVVSAATAAGAAIGLGLLGSVGVGRALMLACASGAAGAILPGLWLDRAVARHHLMLRKSLPDFLDLMTVCLEGGLSLQDAIRRVTDELRLAHPALAVELGAVQRDVELGATVDQALKRFATRTDYDGVRTLSTFIREAQRFGANITEALRSHADMLRSQREQAAEEKAQKAAVKILLPTLLLIFPAIFVVAVGPAVIQVQEAFAGK